MNFILWIIIGGVAGWIASMIMKTNSRQGMLMDIVVGIIGGFIGGWVLGLFNINPGDGLFASLGTSVIGAVIFIGILKAIRPGKKQKQ